MPPGRIPEVTAGRIFGKIFRKIHELVSSEILGGITIEIAEVIHREIPKFIPGRTFKAIPEGVLKSLFKVIFGGFLGEIPARIT